MKNNYLLKFTLFSLAIIALALTISPSYSQQKNIKFEKLQVEDGLSASWIFKFYRDSYGFMWIGTYNNGLNRYDGYNIKVYKQDQGDDGGLASNNIGAIFEDSKRRLWVGNQYGGALNLYQRETDTFKKYWFQSASGSSISSICENHDGRLWIGTNDGLNLFDPETEIIVDFKNDPNKPLTTLVNNGVSNMYLSSKNKLWIATNNGISILDIETKVFSNFTNNPDDIHSLPAGKINAFHEDDKGRIWIATTTKGVCMYEEETNRFISYSYDENDSNSIGNNRALSMSGNGNFLYVGTENGGYNIMNTQTGKFQRYMPDLANENSIGSNSIYASYFDKTTQTVWTGSYNAGVSYYGLNDKNFNHFKPRIGGLNNGKIRDLMETKDGKIWIATDGGGINVYDKKSKKFTYYKHDPKNPKSIPSDAILALHQDKTGSIWAGTYNAGLLKFNPTSNSFIQFKNDPKDSTSFPGTHVYNLHEDKHGFFIRSGWGWFHMDIRTGKFQPSKAVWGFDTGPNDLHLIQVKNGDFWHVNDYGNGVVHVDGATKKRTEYKYDPNNPKSLSNYSVTHIYEDSKGQVWICTPNGLNCFDEESKTFQRYGTKDGMVSGDVNSIVEDKDGNLWLGTGKGLVKITDGINKPENPIIKNYNTIDGIQGDEFSDHCAFISSSGELYFGGTNGFNVFDPSSIQDNPFIPPVKLTGFKVFNKDAGFGLEGSPFSKSIELTDEIKLDYTKSVFTFEFVALNFSQPSKNQYAFMMEGLEKGWNYVGEQRSATYTNLDAREYIFKVKASNNDGIWNENATQIKVTILPPWWETWWFRTLATCLFLGSGIAFFLIRTRQLKEQKILLEKKVKERTAALQDASEEIQVQNEELSQQAEELEQQRDYLQDANELITKNSEQIKASINYAKRIQQAILPMEEELKKQFEEHFVLFRPRDVVSGDFYWMHETDEITYLAVVDCTGHGVPGAFMSMIGSSLLNRIVGEMKVTEPAVILTELHKGIVKALRQESTYNRDGMDMILCAFHKQAAKPKIVFAGAKSSLFVLPSNSENIEEYISSRMSVGGTKATKMAFESQELTFDKGTVIYLTTDGYIDQHRPDRRRFGRKRLREQLEKIQKMELAQQKEYLENYLVEYMNGEPQRDDIAVIGIRL
ncbi:two-component regulator propeller domain-containing protein [Flammeovirgaceae bacterium SG7u.111]|nr:two-component regulator propeller domain-containing protein [Flammeovirgaceae bacterium SG7u.132]WPO37689.1 two-component regulator propeller domain-containing protein [Flammeovirgaceae bacterium SG7u.111]